MPKSFRKKPIVIQAVQFLGTPESLKEVAEFAKGQLLSDFSRVGGPSFCIETLEGAMHITKNDWIIRGVKNEFYPCKPDIFTATYEEV